ncbi:MAG: ATP-binding cassette domain-containing protein [Planctomycetes bacterium]|nr:ATP-binding cassette domain-containing protein [Planctomycetota bacterium]
MDAVILDNLVKSFGAVRAVDGISARVPSGCVYGFLGPNGAGKTTTLRMMMDIIAPDAGRVEILGRPAPRTARERVGYMPEERGLYPRMTARGVLRYVAALKGLLSADARRKADAWLERVDLGGWSARKVRDLSRGMQQRLQFAATAIAEPELLILDEPFSGLDPVNLDVLKGILLSLRDAGTTVVFSTHMMDQAEQLCDSILLINRGRVVLDGRLDDIRRGRRSETILLEIDGGAEAVAALPSVRSVTPLGRRLEVRLADGTDRRQWLAALLGRVEVLSFEQRTPSLHEIFVERVRASDA